MQDAVETAFWVLRNYVRNSKERLLIAACTIDKDEDREIPNEYKKGKKNEGENTVDNMDNLSGKQWIKQVKIGGDG